MAIVGLNLRWPFYVHSAYGVFHVRDILMPYNSHIPLLGQFFPNSTMYFDNYNRHEILKFERKRTNQLSTTQILTMIKQTLLIGLLAMNASLFMMTSCADTPAERKAEAKEDMRDAKQDMQDASAKMEDATDDAAAKMKMERDELAANMRRTGDEINARIDEMDRKMEKASAKEKARWKERRARLVEERDQLDANMKEMGSDMKREWNEFKGDVNRTMDKIADDMKADN